MSTEWWDEILVNEPGLVSHLIEHPVPLKGTVALMPQQSVKAVAMLTPAERMKLRKLKRREKVREMQDKVKMGLLKPPPPKIKMKNLMLVLGKEAVAGPSSIENAVKAQVEERLRGHQQRNEERKLTPDLRRLKNISKWTKGVDYTNKLEISVFLIFKRIHSKNKFKITKNAEQLHLGGLFVQSSVKVEFPDSQEFYPSLVVVEGSHKAVKRFDRLMLQRIDWHETSVERALEDRGEEDTVMKEDEDQAADDEEQDDDGGVKVGGGGVCKRVFKGIDSSKKFVRWSFFHARDLQAVHAFLSERNCLHFWDTVTRYRDNSLDQ